MSKLRRVLVSPFLAGALAVLLVSLAIWLVGDLLQFGAWRPFEPVVNRIVATAILIVIWLIILAVWLWRRRRRNVAMVEEIAAPDPTETAITEENAALNAKFAKALKDLSKLNFKSRFGGSRYLYQLPWYIMIGPPASGKTTVLEKCGLDLPLRSQNGDSVTIDGGSGTRTCDWLFTNEAVFIDTAGRYSTQEDEVVDRAAWRRFLDLLVKHRPAEPINGVIVAVSVADLAVEDMAGIDRTGSALRARLMEIAEVMRARVPVYVVFTKADLLTGFTEYFQTLNEAEREQVWGCTFTLRGGANPAARMEAAEEDLRRVEGEYDRLLGRLGERVFPLLQNERDPVMRTKIFGFPSQFSSLKPVIDRLLKQTFKADAFSETLLLRGFYFTSATQIGQPVDRLISTLNREFGLERRAIGAVNQRIGASFFAKDLLRKVIFAEAGLIAGARRPFALSAGRFAALALCVATPLLLGIGWWRVEAHVETKADLLVAAIADYEFALEDIQVTPVEDNDFVSISAPLAILRDARDALAAPEADAPYYGLGVDQMEILRDRADRAYQTALDDLLRSRLLFRYEAMLDLPGKSSDDVYDALKTYLIVGGRGRTDKDHVLLSVRRDWRENTLAGEANEGLRAELTAHLAAMLSGPKRVRTLDEDAIMRARATVDGYSVARQALRLIEATEEARALRPWSVKDAQGRLAEEVFVRNSGDSLATEISGFYTYEGFHGLVDRLIETAVATALEESWVVDPKGDAGREITRGDVLENAREARRLYFEDYIGKWREVVEDLRITPFVDLEHAAKVLGYMSQARSSPFATVLRDVARNVALDKTPEEGSPILSSAIELAWHRARSRSALISRVSDIDFEGEDAPRRGAAVADAFAELIRYVDEGSSSSGLNDAVAELRALYNVVNNASRGQRRDLSVLSDAAEAGTLMRTAEGAAPIFVATMLKDMIDRADLAAIEGITARLNEIWRATVFPGCRDWLHGRYPFGRGRAVALGDFAALLGPGGLVHEFYRKNLEGLVDEEAQPWRWKRNIDIPRERLAFFKAAAEIRSAFFPDGGQYPSFRIGIFPKALSDEVAFARFAVGGAEALFRQGDGGAAQIVWPGPRPANGAEVTLSSPPIEGIAAPGDEVRVTEVDDWGLFRLIDKGDFKLLRGGDKARLVVGGRGRFARFDLRMDRAVNPISLYRGLNGFTCPRRL